ncbi:hypothetical protein C7Y72_17800 [Paraconexibacter algicola]|uniref:Transcobalamin-like C-terminal domain-containing protein n=1 Tax=Paraconexibacter algicola TaxID=2133960 RepID=A0A2T4UDE9_9ACTN|nr:hypothetical protein C7Y72_17800 [Paraconexibacter algicola]
MTVRPRPVRRLAALLALAGASTTLAACGLGAGATPTDTRLTITQDFGTKVLDERDDPQSRGADTVMRLLQRNAKVQTRYGGGFVQSIDGVAGGTRDGRPVDWFFYVNGVLSQEGATSYEVKEGDHVWWDHHDWGLTNDVPAVVGTYPEPFVHGVEGKRLPVRVECVELESTTCDAVRDRLVSLGIVVGKGGLQRSLAAETIRVIVGRYEQIRADKTVRQLEQGPKVSGVYARPAADGRSIAVLDPRGRTTRTLGPGAGLVAAVRVDDAPPVWVLTGTDDTGLRAATSALDPATLARKFAYASGGGAPDGGLGLPEVPTTAAPATP